MLAPNLFVFKLRLNPDIYQTLFSSSARFRRYRYVAGCRTVTALYALLFLPPAHRTLNFWWCKVGKAGGQGARYHSKIFRTSQCVSTEQDTRGRFRPQGRFCPDASCPWTILAMDNSVRDRSVLRRFAFGHLVGCLGTISSSGTIPSGRSCPLDHSVRTILSLDNSVRDKSVLVPNITASPSVSTQQPGVVKFRKFASGTLKLRWNFRYTYVSNMRTLSSSRSKSNSDPTWGWNTGRLLAWSRRAIKP